MSVFGGFVLLCFIGMVTFLLLSVGDENDGDNKYHNMDQDR